MVARPNYMGDLMGKQAMYGYLPHHLRGRILARCIMTFNRGRGLETSRLTNEDIVPIVRCVRLHSIITGILMTFPLVVPLDSDFRKPFFDFLQSRGKDGWRRWVRTEIVLKLLPDLRIVQIFSDRFQHGACPVLEQSELEQTIRGLTVRFICANDNGMLALALYVPFATSAPGPARYGLTFVAFECGGLSRILEQGALCSKYCVALEQVSGG